MLLLTSLQILVLRNLVRKPQKILPPKPREVQETVEQEHPLVLPILQLLLKIQQTYLLGHM